MKVWIPALKEAFRLRGALSLPKNNDKLNPCCLIIAGSGKIDHNGNSLDGKGLKLNINNRLSDYFTEQLNCGVLSYDKRGCGESISSTDNDLYYRAGPYDFVDDAIACYKYLIESNNDEVQIDTKKLILIGHSEGAILMPLILQKIENLQLPYPHGVILLSGIGETMESALRFQQQALQDELKEKSGCIGWIIRYITRRQTASFWEKVTENIKLKDKDFESSFFGQVKIPLKWFREHLEYNPNELGSIVHCHVLAITGGMDIQTRSSFCTMEYAKSLYPNAKSVNTFIPPNMSHILRNSDAPATYLGLGTEYEQQGKLDLAPDMLQYIESWYKRIC